MTDQRSHDRYAWLALAAIVLLAGVVRFHLSSLPLERDEGEYAYAGQLLLAGVPPYQEAYNMKLPGVYGSYAALLALFGQTAGGIRLGLILLNGVTIVLVYLLGRQVLRRTGALTAAAWYAMSSVGQPVLGAYANAEHFVLFCALAGLLVLLRAHASDRNGLFAAAGALLGAGVLMKQHGLAFLAAAVLSTAALPLMEQRPFRRDDGRRLAFLLAGSIAVYGLLCLVLAAAGVFERYWFWTVTYAREYVTALSPEQAWPELRRNVAALAVSAPLMWLLAGIGIAALIFMKGIDRRRRSFLALVAVLSAASVVPGLYFRPHYFLLLLPAAALLAGLAVDLMTDRLGGTAAAVHLAAPVLLVAAVFGQAAYLQRDYLFRMGPFESSRSSYWINPFPESIEIARFLKARTSGQDRIAILGSEPQILFYADRRSASGHIYMYPLMQDSAFARRMQQEFIRETEAHDPKYLLYVNVPTSWLRFGRSPKDIFEWFDAYQKEHMKLVGVVELYDDRSVFHWERQVRWPVDSKYWIAVFERKGPALPRATVRPAVRSAVPEDRERKT